MCKKLVFLICFVLVLGLASGESVAKKFVQYKVDLVPTNYTPENNYNGTHPGGDWLVWNAWGNIDPDHDGRTLWNVGGSGLNVFLGMDGGHGYNNYDTVEDQVPGPIANGWVKHRSPDEGPPAASFHCVLWGDALLGGEYRVYGYHNDPLVSRPNMPSIIATTYCADNQKANCGCPLDPDCDGVVQTVLGEPNDINVPVQNHTGTDDALVPSTVQFVSDGSPVIITYEAPVDGTAIFNAFILELEVPPWTSGQNPIMDKTDVCPDTTLSWVAGAYAKWQDVYFGTDFNDVNDANTTETYGVYEGNQPADDVNFDPGGLDWGTTYYWRVDTVNDVCSPYFWKGNVWSFTTEDGKAKNPSPADNEFSVATDATLSWDASCLAVVHHVYFSTNFDDVNDGTDPNAGAGQGPQSETTFDPCELENVTRYYWRIDERSESSLVKGDVWTFMTSGGTLFHYDFDGVLDANVHDPCDEIHLTDTTGNVVFTLRNPGGDKLKYAEPNPLYNTGGTSAEFRSDDTEVGLYRGPVHSVPPVRGVDITDLTAPEYTIEMWIYANSFYDDTRLIGKRTGGYFVDVTDGGMVLFSQAGGDPIGDSNSVIDEEMWYHIAAIFDSNEPNEPQKLYIMGELVASGGTTATNPVDNDAAVTIGISTYMDSKGYEKWNESFDGRIDELRVSDLVLSVNDFLLRGDRGKAWLPHPMDYETHVRFDVDLDWRPGDYVADVNGHDVFIGTNWNDINDVNRSNIGSYPNVDYNNVDANMEDIPYNLKLGQTYYWRVDEFNDSCDASPWKGNIWRFTVSEYIIVDDFEDYTEGAGSAHPITDGWTQGYLTPPYTGSIISLGLPYYGHAVRDQQSMLYYYDNTSSNYSETGTKSLDPCDFTYGGVKTLTLWFHGEVDEGHYNDANETEQLYVGLKDDDDDYAEVKYPMEDMDNIRLLEWTDWNIVINDFKLANPDLDIENIKTLYIGFGDRDYTAPPWGGYGFVYFDDIVLYPPTCIPSERPEWFKLIDFNGDCIVDFGDVEIMAADWLDADVNFPVVEEPCDANLVGWWKLDEGDGNTTADSSLNNNTGTLETNDVDVFWVTTGHDGNALEFDGGRVRIPDTEDLRLTGDVSVSAWINFSESQNSARVVVKGADNREAYGLEVDNDSQLVFYVREDPNDPCVDDYDRYPVSSDDLDQDEWTHIAGTFDSDGKTVKCYINGVLKGTADANVTYILSQDTNDLAIGNRSDEDNRGFEGMIDDVRLYDCALSEAEVAWLASDGTGLVSVQSIAELVYDEPPGQRAVNFRDLAELGKSWFEERLYPAE